MKVMHQLRYEFDQSKSMQELGHLFGQILNVPDDILESERARLSLYVMIESAKITKERRLS